MSTFSELTEGLSAETINQRMINAKKVAKWESKGLLEGLKGHKKSHMARLLENQAKYLLEASDTGDIKGFQAIAFPLVRRVYGQLLAQEICSVQPMALPAGLVFWMDFTFGTNKAGTGYTDWFAGVSGGTGTRSVAGDPMIPLTGGSAGTGGHYYLGNSYTQVEATCSININSSASVTAWSEVEYDFELSAAVANNGLFKFTVTLGDDATATNIDETNYKSFAVSGTAAILGAAYTPIRRHNQYNAVTKTLTVYFSGTNSGAGGGVNSGSAVTASYVKKTATGADTSGTTLNPAFEYAFDNSDKIPQIDIKLASMPVVAQDRKLKVTWTPELAQDLNAYHSIDAEAELTQMMADQIALDIDSEVLVDMVNKAQVGGGVKLYWDRRPGFFVNRNTGAPLAGASFTGTQQEWYQSLMETITDCSNQLHRRNLRSGATFLVMSPDVATILENLPQWRPVLDMDPAGLHFSLGIEKVGTLGQRWSVYKAPFFFRNLILLGIKGTEWLTTSYVYAPYVPLIVTPTIHEPTNLTPVKGAMTRYAKQCIRADHFGLVVVKGMEIF